jgi:hypothetical protein
MLLASISIILMLQFVFFARDINLYRTGAHYQLGTLAEPIDLLLLVKDLCSIGFFVGLLLLALSMVYNNKIFAWLPMIGSFTLLISLLGYIITFLF